MIDGSIEIQEPQVGDIGSKLEHFPNSHAGAISELICSNAITLNPSLKGQTPKSTIYFPDPNSGNYEESYVVNLEKAKEVLQPFEISTQIMKSADQLSPQEVYEDGQKALKETIKAFVTHGDISPELAVLVGKIIRPSGVEVNDHHCARFFYPHDYFPEDGEEKGSLEIGLTYLASHLKQFKEITTWHGFHFSEQQLLHLVLRNTASHEYGHAIDRALRINEWKRREREDPKANVFSSQVDKEFNNLIYDTLAPDSRLQEIFAYEPENADYANREGTSSERIATGFEFLGLSYALNELGVNDQKVAAIVSDFKDVDRKSLYQYEDVLRLARQHHLNFELLGAAINKITVSLKEENLFNLASVLAFGFYSRNFGYYFPLTGEQLHEYISSFNISPVKTAEAVH